ncbi:hypothetical protein ABT009_08400 [Streptomyces sp. NPDC002896]|uniref:hypothetical protein n=1 Tax=Streptomyces sp. NPDC002896 TaxID=3154438 RepID=UPI003327BAEB
MRTTRALAVSAAAVVALGLAAPSAVAGGDEPNNNRPGNGIGGDGRGPNGLGGNGNGFGPNGNLGAGGNGKDNGPGGNPGNGLGGNGFPGFPGNGFPGNGLGGNGFPGFPGNGLGGDGFPGLGGNGFPGFPGNGLGGDGYPGFPGNGPGVGGVGGVAGNFGVDIDVEPSVVRPGQHNVRVTVAGNVAGIACQLAGSTVESPAFPTTRLRRGGGNTAIAVVTINRNTPPGTYGVTARCGNLTFIGENELAVVGRARDDDNGRGGNGRGDNGRGGNGRGDAGRGDAGRGGDRDNNGLPGPVAGGLGGSLTGATAPDMAIGGGLVAAALASGGVFWLRRRAEKRG